MDRPLLCKQSSVQSNTLFCVLTLETCVHTPRSWVTDRASANAPLQRVQAQIRHKQAPPYGLPSHLFRFDLELASAPPRRGHWVLFLMIVRSFLALKNQKQRVPENRVYSELRLRLGRPNGGGSEDPNSATHYHEHGQRLHTVIA